MGTIVRIAKWTLSFVLVNQIALVVIQEVAGGATAEGSGGGLSVYSYAYATISCRTHCARYHWPRRCCRRRPGWSRRRLAGVRDETIDTMRLVLTAMVPAAVAFFALSVPLAEFVFGFGRGTSDAYPTGRTLMAFAFGLIPFSLHFLCLRTYYALENNKAAFLIQIAIGATNASLAVLIVLLLAVPPAPPRTASRPASRCGPRRSWCKLLAHAVAGIVTFLVLARLLKISEVSSVPVYVRVIARWCVAFIGVSAPNLIAERPWELQPSGPGQLAAVG